MQLWTHVISWHSPFLKIGFMLASKKGGKGGGGRVSAWGAVHIAAALTGYKKALVGTGWVFPMAEKGSSTFVGTPFLPLQTIFSWEKHSLVGQP